MKISVHGNTVFLADVHVATLSELYPTPAEKFRQFLKSAPEEIADLKAEIQTLREQLAEADEKLNYLSEMTADPFEY